MVPVVRSAVRNLHFALWIGAITSSLFDRYYLAYVLMVLAYWAVWCIWRVDVRYFKQKAAAHGDTNVE